MVVQLLGGNDGLNTVVPHGIDGYNRGRRALRISSSQIHKITPEIGLHPSMGAMAKLLEKGRLSVVQGVGYPNPDRSHFRRWRSGRPAAGNRCLAGNRLARPCARRRAGKPGDDPPGLHIGSRSLPLALRSRRKPTFPRWRAWKATSSARRNRRTKATRSALSEMASAERRDDDPLLGFISQSTLSAYESSSRLEQLAQERDRPEVPELRPGQAPGADRPDHQGRFRHADLLHVARRLRHPRQSARHARRAADRALRLDRRLPRRPCRGRAGGPRSSC